MLTTTGQNDSKLDPVVQILAVKTGIGYTISTAEIRIRRWGTRQIDQQFQRHHRVRLKSGKNHKQIRIKIQEFFTDHKSYLLKKE